MTFDWRWVAALLAIAVVVRLFRPLLGFAVAPRISARALASQPDQIHLEPAVGGWAGTAARDRFTADLAGLGFEPAGDFSVRELTAFRLRLLAHGAESLYAMVGEHPQRGVWAEIFCRFTDGEGATWTTLSSHGLDPRPGHPVHHMPHAGVAALWKAVRRERPAKPLQPASAAAAVADFEHAWAESIAWRKQHGISRIEVARVAARGEGRKAA